MVFLQFAICRVWLPIVVLAILITPVTTIAQTSAIHDTIIVTMEGVNCLAPQYVLFPMEADQLTLSGLSTCQHFNDYSTTCLDSYDGGEDYIIQLEVQMAMYAYIRFDPKGTPWTGIAIDNSCPPDFDCLAKSTSSSSLPHYIQEVYLDAGTYYIMIDTWPSPTCIPEFELQIIRFFPDPWGIDCTLPLTLNIAPEDLPLTIGPQSTLTSQNNYSETCLGAYDEGEDLFYQFILPESLKVNLRVDPNGTAGSGFVLHDSCPPTSECMAKATDNLGQEYGVNGVSLPAGTYYLMIDSWSMQTPINHMYIHIDSYYRCGDVDVNDIVNISDAVYLINYIFSGGPPPAPLAAGDVNLSELITISDAVYLINYIFAGGPAPCAN